MRGPEAGRLELMTVLFVDLSGSFSLIAGLSSLATAHYMNGILGFMIRAVVTHRGEVNRCLGDGLLAFFTGENDVVNALSAAREVRQSALQAGLAITCGMDRGEVYLGPVGSELHQESGLMGPTVWLAARLQARALSGEILVGESIWRREPPGLKFVKRTLELKGLPQPVVAGVLDEPQV